MQIAKSVLENFSKQFTLFIIKQLAKMVHIRPQEKCKPDEKVVLGITNIHSEKMKDCYRKKNGPVQIKSRICTNKLYFSRRWQWL